MTNDELVRLLDELAAAEGARVLCATPSWSPTPACPSLPRLERGARTADWTEVEREHVARCAYCQKTLAVAARIPPKKVAAAGAKASIPAATPRAPGMRLDLRARPEARKPQVPPLVRVGKGGSAWREKKPEPGEGASQLDQPPAEEGQSGASPVRCAAWGLAAVAGQPIALPEELAVHYYGDAEVNKVRLWLHGVANEAGEVRPQVEVLPGPTKAPMTVVVTFPNGDVSALEVPVEPGGLRVGWSNLGEVLSAAALSLEGTAPRPEQEWPVSVELS